MEQARVTPQAMSPCSVREGLRHGCSVCCCKTPRDQNSPQRYTSEDREEEPKLLRHPSSQGGHPTAMLPLSDTNRDQPVPVTPRSLEGQCYQHLTANRLRSVVWTHTLSNNKDREGPSPGRPAHSGVKRRCPEHLTPSPVQRIPQRTRRG